MTTDLTAERVAPARHPWFYLSIAIVSEVIGTTSLRGALDYPWLYAVMAVAFLIAFYGLARTLSAGMGIGVAYGIWGAAGVALTAVLGYVFFGETLNLTMITGIGLVILGVMCVEFGKYVHTKTPAPSVEQEQ